MLAEVGYGKGSVGSSWAAVPESRTRGKFDLPIGAEALMFTASPAQGTTFSEGLPGVYFVQIKGRDGQSVAGILVVDLFNKMFYIENM